MLQDSRSKFSLADGLALVCGLVLLVAFFFLPWLTIEGEMYTGLRTLLEIDPRLNANALGLFFVPIAGVFAVLCAGAGLARVDLRKHTGIVLLFVGITSLLYYSVFTLQNILQNPMDVLALTGIGFQLGVFATLGLVLQLALQRPMPDKYRRTAAEKTELARRISLVILIIAVGVSAYLSYLKAAQASAVCVEGGKFDCGVVLNSVYSEIAGIPIAWLGLGTNLVVITLLLLEKRIALFQTFGVVFAFGVVLFAFLYSVYLVYLQAFVMQAYCPWCLSHEALITILFGLALYRLFHWFGTDADLDEAEA